MNACRLTLALALASGIGCASDVDLPEPGGPASTSTSMTTISAGGAGGSGDPSCAHLDTSCQLGALENGACIAVPLADGASCDDGLACTTLDRCEGGRCIAGLPATCASSSACLVPACNERTNACELLPAPDGVPCEDGSLCTAGDTCASGECVPGAPIECPANPSFCLSNVCQPLSGCVAVPEHVGELCNPDDTICAESRCNPLGECFATPFNDGLTCAPDGPCSQFKCVQGQCFESPFADGLACEDGVSCTVAEACAGGACYAGTSNCPAPPEACLDPHCETGLFRTCVAVPSVLNPPCEDPSPCRGAGTCTHGFCGAAVAMNDGATCDDARACTTDEVCAAGDCVGLPVTACFSGDGCCPAGCTSVSDADCGGVLYMASTQGHPGFFAFDLGTSAWQTLPDPPSPPRSGLAVLGNSVVMLGQDFALHAFDPGTQAWSVLTGTAPPAPAVASQPEPGGSFLGVLSNQPFIVLRPEYRSLRRVESSWVDGNLIVANAGSTDRASGELFVRDLWSIEVYRVDPAALLVEVWSPYIPWPTRPDARFGVYTGGTFYTLAEPPSILAVFGDSTFVDTGVIPADPNPSSAVDPESGLIYLGPSDSAGAFQSFDPVTEVLVDLPTAPAIPDGYMSSVVVARAPSTP